LKSVAFYPDLAKIRCPQKLQTLKSFLEIMLFFLALPRIRARIRASGSERLFALFGGNPWFLIVVDSVRRWTRLPLDICLVDDLEQSARLAGQPLVSRLVRWIEPRVLCRADRVFTISRGYAEHLERKYGVVGRWLPIPVPASPIVYHPYMPRQPDVRTIAFIGAVNPLYVGALKEILRAIKEWNEAGNRFNLRLLLLTYTEPDYIERELGASHSLETRFRTNSEEFSQCLRESWAIVVPYSFADDVRLMVSTSFPSKLVASFLVGRPIIVYGPSYASLPRYFQENGLPLCAHSLPQLTGVLREVERRDTMALMQSYDAIIDRLHSPRYLRSILADLPEQTSSVRRH
jgi:hypothetical protein